MHDYSQSSDPGSRMMAGFMFGAVVGAGIALLLAPATGEETRRRLKETAGKLRENADEAMSHVKERLGEARHGVENLGREARDAMGSTTGTPRTNPNPGSRPA